MTRLMLSGALVLGSLAASAQADDTHTAPAAARSSAALRDHTGKSMVLIPPGEFLMGDNSGYDRDEKPEHKVRLSKGFYMDQHEVTRGEFAVCVKAGICFWPLKERTVPIRPKGPTQRDNWGLKYCGPKQFRQPGDHPLTCIDYPESRYFCEVWRGGRLPTEAEWEWAARGGLEQKRFPWGDELPTNDLAHFGKYTGTGPVGRYPPNGYGLYDMAGSVWEWTNDWYDGDYYRHSPAVDPKGACEDAPKCPGFPHRTMRSGSWITGSLGMRVSYRNHHRTWNRFEVVGLRCVKDL